MNHLSITRTPTEGNLLNFIIIINLNLTHIIESTDVELNKIKNNRTGGM